MATGKSAAGSGNGADERALRTFLEHAAPIILASRALDEAQCDAVIALADKLGLSRQQLLCELRLLEQRGVITSAPWDRMDARGGHPAAARDARPAPPGGPAAKSARTAPDPDGRQQLDSPRPEAEARGPAESDSATAPTSGPPRVSSPAKRRQDQFRELALKRLGTANSMTPRLRRQLVADGTGMGLSSEEINSVLFSLPRTTPPVPPHAVPAAPAQPAGTSPPVAGPAAHTPADPPRAAPPVAPPPSDADSAKEKPKTPPAEVFGKWVTEQLARLATDVLTADDEASLVGVGINRFRLARVLATHVLRDAAEDRGMRLERDLNDASCHSTADASAQGSSAAEDDRLKEFFDQAAPILAMHRGINAQSRVMLNAIAERLGLSPEDLDRAITALQRSPVDADEDDPRQIERREAYRGYLRRAIAQLPDGILTFKMERRLIEAGEHFHGVTPKWIKPTINEVASETGARFISEKQASDHIAKLVDDLLQRSTWVDATKRNRVYAEGTRWGLDPPDIEAIIRQRSELKKKDIAADRRRTRWLLMAVPVVAGLAVGLVLWMSLRAGQNDTVAAAKSSQSTGPPVPKTQTPPATDWWDDDLRIAAVRLRVAHPVLKPLLENCQDKDPTVRASSYKQLIGNHAGTPADEEDQESLRTLLTGLYALDPVGFAARGIPESLVGGLDSLDDRLPARADELALMYWKCRTAVLMLKHPKLPTERSAELVKLIESALNCAPDRLLDAEPLQRECLGALTRRLYDVLTKAASKDPQLAAALHVALASEAVDCLDDATMERLDMEFLDAILPALGTDWTKQHELIGRMAHADEPSVVLKMLEIYAASTDDSLRGYLEHLFVDRLKLTEDDIASMTEQELLDRVRKGLGVAASGERPAGWQGLADDAKAILAAAVPETDAKAVLGHTVGLARLATMACALAHADAGRATFERLQTAGPIELEDESAPWSTTSRPATTAPPSSQSTIMIDQSVRQLLMPNTTPDTRIQLLRLIANRVPEVTDIPAATGLALAEYLTLIKPDEQEHVQMMPFVGQLVTWNVVRLGLADQLDKIGGRDSQLQDVYSTAVGTEVRLDDEAGRRTVRRQLMTQVVAGLAAAPTTGSTETGPPFYDKASEALAAFYTDQATLLAAPVDPSTAASQPSAVVATMILYLAERLKAGKLDAAQQDFVDRLPHELRAVEFVARDELQYSAALGLIWLRLLAVHVAQERPDKASAARQIVQRFQTGQPANANVLNQLRDLEAGLLELWLLFRPATDRNESQAINGVAEG